MAEPKTDNSDFSKKLDEIIAEIANNTMLAMTADTDGKANYRANKIFPKARQAIIQLFDKEVISEDEVLYGAENEANDISLDDYETNARNGLRATQRAIINGGKQDG